MSNKNEAFDAWAQELLPTGGSRMDQLYTAWYKHDNSELEWQRYYWALRRAFEAGAGSV